MADKEHKQHPLASKNPYDNMFIESSVLPHFRLERGDLALEGLDGPAKLEKIRLVFKKISQRLTTPYEDATGKTATWYEHLKCHLQEETDKDALRASILHFMFTIRVVFNFFCLREANQAFKQGTDMDLWYSATLACVLRSVAGKKKVEELIKFLEGDDTFESQAREWTFEFFDEFQKAVSLHHGPNEGYNLPHEGPRYWYPILSKMRAFVEEYDEEILRNGYTPQWYWWLSTAKFPGQNEPPATVTIAENHEYEFSRLLNVASVTDQKFLVDNHERLKYYMQHKQFKSPEDKKLFEAYPMQHFNLSELLGKDEDFEKKEDEEFDEFQILRKKIAEFAKDAKTLGGLITEKRWDYVAVALDVVALITDVLGFRETFKNGIKAGDVVPVHELEEIPNVLNTKQRRAIKNLKEVKAAIPRSKGIKKLGLHLKYTKCYLMVAWKNTSLRLMKLALGAFISEQPWWEKLLLIADVMCQIGAFVATDGASIAFQIVSTVIDIVESVEDVLHLLKIDDEIKEETKKVEKEKEEIKDQTDKIVNPKGNEKGP